MLKLINRKLFFVSVRLSTFFLKHSDVEHYLPLVQSTPPVAPEPTPKPEENNTPLEKYAQTDTVDGFYYIYEVTTDHTQEGVYFVIKRFEQYDNGNKVLTSYNCYHLPQEATQSLYSALFKATYQEVK